MSTGKYRFLNTKLAGLFSCLCFLLLLPFTVLSAEPEGFQPKAPTPDMQWSAPIRLFQKTISRADGSRCPMHPTCSQYALEAFNKYGFFTAWMLTSDRLLRCGHSEIHMSPKVIVRGQRKVHDPLAANTFWWDKP